jgi:hypothetical protein
MSARDLALPLAMALAAAQGVAIRPPAMPPGGQQLPFGSSVGDVDDPALA